MMLVPYNGPPPDSSEVARLGGVRKLLTPNIVIFEPNKSVLVGYRSLNDLKFYIANLKNIFNIVVKT